VQRGIDGAGLSKLGRNACEADRGRQRGIICGWILIGQDWRHHKRKPLDNEKANRAGELRGVYREVREEIVMNKPYINVEGILELFCMTVEETPSQPTAADSLHWLAEFLAREHTTMNASDWNGLVRVGALLWQAQNAWDGAPRTR
jgi:hypothetical protein